VTAGSVHELAPLRPLGLRRVAMLSVHTSPLDQPGIGDAGGMNVYIVELAKRLAAAGTDVEIFTRATSSDLPPAVPLAPGVTVRHVVAGPFEGLAKDELPAQLCTFAREVLREGARQDAGWYDLVHSHYWLSGQVGALAADRWGVPLVHSMHTMAKVKNAALAEGDRPEPVARAIGEQQVVDAADMLIANAQDEARQLVELYGAIPERVVTIHPGVDLDVFRPADRASARKRLGLPTEAEVVSFVGRVQPLKAPDVLVRAVAELLRRDPALRSRLVVPIIGGRSGTGTDEPALLVALAAELGVSDVLRFVPPVEQHELADWYAAASLVCVPSYNESFGLVAIEAQACGTPVVAAAVGGLTTAVLDGETGLLVAGHDPLDYADAIESLLVNPARLATMRRAAVDNAASFSWSQTAARTVAAYRSALTGSEDRLLAASR